MYPTMDGILDSALHGSKSGGKFVGRYPGFGEVELTAQQLGLYVKKNFPNISGIRLFTCWGEEAGAGVISKITGLPVVSSTGGTIGADAVTGAMNWFSY